MCGIFSIINNKNVFTEEFIKKEFLKGQSRGPEYTDLKQVSIECTFGFHRLAINGLNPESNQPLIINSIVLICNGEIYNYKELYNLLNITPNTDSDCEVIIHLYLKFGIEHTLQLLDGVFAFILCDNRLSNTDISASSKLFIARDPFGVRPLYKLTKIDKTLPKIIPSIFASEVKMLEGFLNNHLDYSYEITHFKPGTYTEYTLPYRVCPNWTCIKENIEYHSNGFNSILNQQSEMEIISNIQYYLINAVKKRVLNTDRPIACLLSGGLDSSLITALVSNICQQELHLSKIVHTFSIGFENSEDLKYAKIVSNYLNTIHTEIIIDEKIYFETIPKVIKAVECYDTTTIRASVGNYLLGDYISKNSELKVIFNGDGSDELCGGYLYMSSADNCIEFDRETRRLLKDIHMFDVLRSDKCISSHGLEPRTPFLDRSFVNYYLGINPSIRFHTQNSQIEKYLLRTAFSSINFLNEMDKQILPDEILWRKKEAFSDGLNKEKSLSSIVESGINQLPILIKDQILLSSGDTLEKQYYKYLFDIYYPNVNSIVPYFWMPKYIKATDPSAKTLSTYPLLEKVEQNHTRDMDDDNIVLNF
jgi:asparagine synthase (glutamine-hydrolysing)